MSNRAKLFIPVVFFFLMLGLLLFALDRNRDPNLVPSALIFRPIPEFTLPDLMSPELEHASTDIRGGITLINFWATWCPPCYIEHPYLMELSQREDNIRMIGVNYDDPDQEAAQQFITDRGNPFEYVLVDINGRLGIDFGVTGPPETFIVDANGVIRYRHVGVINEKIWQEVFLPKIDQIVD